MKWHGKTTPGSQVAETLPEDARVLALAYAEEEIEAAARLADLLVTSAARRREHTLVADFSEERAPLDAILGGRDTEGLPGALDGRVRLTGVAIQRPDRPFVYLPTGRDPGAMPPLLHAESFRSFVERVRERGGTLFLLMPDGRLDQAVVRELVDGYLALGSADLTPHADLPCHGVVALDAIGELEAALAPADHEGPADSETTGRAPEAEADGMNEEARTASDDAPPVSADPETLEPAAAWRRHGGEPAGVVARALLGVAVIAVLITGWWALAGGLGADAGAGETTMAAPPEAAAADSGSTFATLDPAELLAASERSPVLRYSVLIASYARRADADDRLATLESNDGGLFFVAPTPVRGGVYHRVFAGAFEDRDAAATRMARLVEEGHKDEVNDWDVRPTRFAFRLGAFARRDEARARRNEAVELGLPAYVIAAGWVAAEQVSRGTLPDSVWTVYAGGYESQNAARALATEIESLEQELPLVERHGHRPAGREETDLR